MFCLEYFPTKRHFYETNFANIDELMITYRAGDRTLPDFLQLYSSKSIVIKIQESLDEIDIKLLRKLYNRFTNFKLAFYLNDKQTFDLVEQYNLPYFFLNHVCSWDVLHGLLKYHPTDMYICEDLGFSLHLVSQILHSYKINIRVYPNICQSNFPETPSLKTFFIRPEDVQAYSSFVDVFELISDENSISVLFKSYVQDKVWFGKINEIIPSFKGDLNSKFLIPNFGAVRSVCRKRCMWKLNSCTICDRFADVAEDLENNKIVVRRKKNLS